MGASFDQVARAQVESTSGQRGIESTGIHFIWAGGPNGIEVNFDHVRLDAVAVPEPANVGGVIGVGLAALALRRQFARQAAATRQA